MNNDERWAVLGEISELPEGKPVLKKVDRLGLAVVREGARVHAIDDRCPHQGYPLSQGCVRNGVLTCEWHNWKFDLASGACTFGGEPVRRYATKVDGGAVLVDLAIDRAAEAARFEAGLVAAMIDGDVARATREALRLGDAKPARGPLAALEAGFEVLARDTADRAEYGFDHGLALLSDACEWAERGWIDATEAFAISAACAAEPSRHLGARKRALGEPPAIDDAKKVASDLMEERREDAEARVRHLAASRDALEVARDALVPFVATHILDYGHGAIFVAKALELAARFPRAQGAIFASVAVELAWATADTKLPPFAATRAALDDLDRASPSNAAFDRRALEAAVLAGEREGVAACARALKEGADARAVLRAIGHAAALRLARFDRAWERRVDAEASVLDVTHAVTFTESAIALAPLASPRDAARLAVLAAGFVGKLKRADAAEATSTSRPAHASLFDAARARDEASARAIARELGERRLDAYREIAPFAALEAAVRPILFAHTVKVTEALRRLELGDEEADGAYLDACLSFVVPARVERSYARIAFVAKKFLADGRPPEAIY